MSASRGGHCCPGSFYSSSGRSCECSDGGLEKLALGLDTFRLLPETKRCLVTSSVSSQGKLFFSWRWVWCYLPSVRRGSRWPPPSVDRGRVHTASLSPWNKISEFIDFPVIWVCWEEYSLMLRGYFWRWWSILVFFSLFLEVFLVTHNLWFCHHSFPLYVSFQSRQWPAQQRLMSAHQPVWPGQAQGYPLPTASLVPLGVQSSQQGLILSAGFLWAATLWWSDLHWLLGFFVVVVVAFYSFIIVIIYNNNKKPCHFNHR